MKRANNDDDEQRPSKMQKKGLAKVCLWDALFDDLRNRFNASYQHYDYEDNDVYYSD